jgi:hypothetical protein
MALLQFSSILYSNHYHRDQILVLEDLNTSPEHWEWDSEHPQD